MTRQQHLITLSDGTEHVVTPDLRDKLAAETYFRVNKRYGSIGDNGFRYAAVLSWSAGKRAGHFDIDLDQFIDATNPDGLHAVDVEFYDDEDEDAEAVTDLGEGTGADPLTS